MLNMSESPEVNNSVSNIQGIDDTQTEIDLMGLLFRLLDRWYLIALCAFLCAGGAGVYSWFVATPIYEATTKIYVTNTEKESLINLTDLQIGNYLTNDYMEVFKVWEVHEEVRKNLNLPYSVGQLSGMLTVANPSETRILSLSVRSADPQQAADIANEYAQVAKEYIIKTMATEGPNIFSVATVPKSPVSPQKTRNLVLGFLVGVVLACGIIVLLYVLDDKLRTSEDIIRCSGLPTLAVIPITDVAKDMAEEERKHSKKVVRRDERR